MHKEIIGQCELYCGDCREVLPNIVAVESLITDPPYGVDFTGKVTKHTNKSGQISYSDTEEDFRNCVLPAIRQALSIAQRAAIFSGVRRLMEYPAPTDIGGIISPNGAGMSPWGFGCYNPVLFYGVSPYLSKRMGSRPTAALIYHPGLHVTGESHIDHPCPKPVAFMKWAVGTASLAGDVVLDTFMGSGTTGVACVKMGRKFIGIELEPKYFDIACRRIEDAYRQPDMFITQAAAPAQTEAGL